LGRRLFIGDRVRIILTVAGEEYLDNKTGIIVEVGMPPETSNEDVLPRQGPRLEMRYWVVRLDGTGKDVSLREEALETIV
jgi:hypothetical protein